jgi:hypothetical protein
MSILDDRLNKIEEKISDKSFRENKGLGNEVGYYIFDYPARDELLVRNHIEYLKNKINKSNLEFRIIEFDLYDMMINILKEHNYVDLLIKLEKSKGFEHIYEAIGNVLGISEYDSLNLIVDYINKSTTKGSVVFITGVGKCYPIVRSHNVLNNLHQVLDNLPVVMFFPGEYSGQDLHLFGTIKDDNYYRAFKLV